MNSLLLYSNPTNKACKVLLYQTKNSKWSVLKLRQISTSSPSFNAQPASPPPQNQTQPQQQQQQQQQKSSGGGGGSTAFKLIGLTVTSFALAVGYAVQNPDTRRQFESVIPQSSHLFSIIDGFYKPTPAVSAPPVDFPSKLKTIDPAVPKANEEKKKETKPATAAPTAPAQSTAATKSVATSSQKLKEQTPAASKPAAAPALAQQEEPTPSLDWKKTLKDFDLQQEATIDAVETRLRTLNASGKLRVAEALNSSYVAIESLNRYRAALRAALDETKSDESKDLQWRQVTDLFDMQTTDVNEANQKFQIARNTLNDADQMIREIKSSEFSKNVKNLRDSQIDLVNQYRLLQAEQTKLSEAVVHANVLKNYTQEQKKARNQFLKEMQALQPEGIHGINKSATGDQLSMDELNSLLIHAHKRVMQLQKQLENTQLTQNKQIQSALEEQRHQSAEAAKSLEASVYELHRKEFLLEQEKTLEAERERANQELSKELSRQAAAHNNHLAQMLKLQQDELKGLYEKRLISETERVKLEFYSQISDSLGRLKGIEHALNARANLELQANNSKQLWLAVQNLAEVLNSKAEELSADAELVHVKQIVNKIKEAAPDNQFIQNIIGSIPDRVVQNGLWSEPDLKERFAKLKTICNRVALIDDRGGSLFKYFISYVQSFFIFQTRIDKSKLANQEALNLDEATLNTFTILDYAEYFLEQGNLEYAVRLMQQLKGEPRRLANDWTSEALTLLEIKQACELLTAYISSVYIGTKFK